MGKYGDSENSVSKISPDMSLVRYRLQTVASEAKESAPDSSLAREPAPDISLAGEPDPDRQKPQTET